MFFATKAHVLSEAFAPDNAHIEGQRTQGGHIGFGYHEDAPCYLLYQQRSSLPTSFPVDSGITDE